ncbi:unnamed protein product [Didymodactylos carnosus]|uniref:Mutator-like transposase domain-containing protein n=1 Tax=Didymodactylos carnosus TaxID=1234261 RepID=A0A8S2WS19_9BILA|nr:unnamed protein product [Didymodactylos carnosus]
MTDMNMMLVLGGAVIGLNRRGLSKVVGTLGMLPSVKLQNFQKYENGLVVGIKENDDEKYKELLDEHLESGCEANYEGSAGGMKSAAIAKMFCRSEEKHQLRYLQYIADDDTKTDVPIVEVKPYGDSVVIDRKQCINHFSKRMRTLLSTIKRQYGKTRLSDKKIM